MTSSLSMCVATCSCVCVCVCACRGHWPLTGAKSCLSVKSSRVNTDSQSSVNCALPLVTVKLALSLGQLPGYIHTVRHLSSPKPAQRCSAAPEPGWVWKWTICARGKNVTLASLELCQISEKKKTKFGDRLVLSLSRKTGDNVGKFNFRNSFQSLNLYFIQTVKPRCILGCLVLASAMVMTMFTWCLV